MTDTLIIKRVAYGRDDTKIEDREYRIFGFSSSISPVGTILNWIEFAKGNNYQGILVIEKDGTERIEELRRCND